MVSAPKSGLKDFLSLKFLNNLMVEAFSRTAYSDESAAQTNSCAVPNDLFLRAIAAAKERGEEVSEDGVEEAFDVRI